METVLAWRIGSDNPANVHYMPDHPKPANPSNEGYFLILGVALSLRSADPQQSQNRAHFLNVPLYVCEHKIGPVGFIYPQPPNVTLGRYSDSATEGFHFAFGKSG